MKDHKLAALIDQYLLGTISPQDKSHLEQMMETDPSVAEAVREHQVAFKAIQMERNRLLKEKLRALDQDDLKRQGFFSTRSGMLTFAVVALFLFYYLASAYYSVECIAGRNLESYSSMGLPTQGSTDLEVSWREAELAFQAKHYQTAILRYTSLAGQKETEAANIAQWNILMVRLAMEGPTPSWKQDLDLFTEGNQGVLGTKAHKLSNFMKSAYGRFFTRHFQEKLSSIKPRLI